MFRWIVRLCYTVGKDAIVAILIDYYMKLV